MSAAVIARLLDTLDALEFIARHMHPPRLAMVVATLQERDATLRAALAAAVWPEHPAILGDQIMRAAERALRACDGLRGAVNSPDGMRQTYRALRQAARRIRGAVPFGVDAAVGKSFLPGTGAAGRPGTAGPTGCRCGATGRANRRHACRERHRRTWRLLGVRAGGLRSSPAVSAGDGAAWRLGTWQAVPVELAARGAQPRRDLGGAHRDRRHLVADGTAGGQRASRSCAGAGRAGVECGSQASAADRDERWRHVQFAQRTG